MKFKFETGEVIECFDEGIAKILRSDKRYEEVITKEVIAEEKPVKKSVKGGNSNGKV